MADDELAVRVRDYARGRRADDPEIVSSAWLARELDADPRTIAAALRPYGVRPAQVERGVRGYLIVELAGLDLREPGTTLAYASAPGGGGVPADRDPAGAPSGDGPRPALEPVPPVSALAALSAGAGHDMAPALRAAGLL